MKNAKLRIYSFRALKWTPALLLSLWLGCNALTGAEPGEPEPGRGGAGVGSSSSSSSSGAGGSGGSTDQTGAQPPKPGPTGHPGDGAGDTVLAISKLYLGDVDRDGTPDTSNGWKQYGFDIDGKISTKASTDLCKPALMAAPSDVYPDGNNGIDNAFGKTVFPIFLGFAPDASDKINQSISDGKFTIMLDLVKLGSAADYNPLLAKRYGGGDLGKAPAWDGTDAWPLVYELLNNGDPSNPKVQFPMSYTVNNTWVSGSKTSLSLSLPLAGLNLNLPINNAIIAMDLAADHKSATNGTIAGIIGTEAFISELKKVIGSFDKGLCMGSTFDSIANQIRQASDIGADGSQNPTKTCDGISIGLGFDAKLVKLGPVAAPQQPTPDSCAGAGGAGGAGCGTCADVISASASVPCAGAAATAYKGFTDCVCLPWNCGSLGGGGAGGGSSACMVSCANSSFAPDGPCTSCATGAANGGCQTEFSNCENH